MRQEHETWELRTASEGQRKTLSSKDLMRIGLCAIFKIRDHHRMRPSQGYNNAIRTGSWFLHVLVLQGKKWFFLPCPPMLNHAQSKCHIFWLPDGGELRFAASCRGWVRAVLWQVPSGFIYTRRSYDNYKKRSMIGPFWIFIHCTNLILSYLPLWNSPFLLSNILAFEVLRRTNIDRRPQADDTLRRC